MVKYFLKILGDLKKKILKISVREFSMEFNKKTTGDSNS